MFALKFYSKSVAEEVKIGRPAWKSSVDYFDGIDRKIIFQARCCILTGTAAHYEES
jgi:hypothetical protein